MNYLILLTALLPVAILVFYIYRKDKSSPEPAGQLLKAFFLGVLSAPLSMLISLPLWFIGVYPEEVTTIWGGVATSFFGAAIPEETAKFVMLWLVLRRNRYFDEKMDGIVYAVFVSLGFAALENIMYIFGSGDMFVATAVARAIFSVPGHCCFGILMGYYYSLSKFYPKSPRKNKLLILLAPIVAHGVFNSLLYTIGLSITLSSVLSLAFLIFCYKLWKHCSKSINEHLSRDNSLNCITD